MIGANYEDVIALFKPVVLDTPRGCMLKSENLSIYNQLKLIGVNYMKKNKKQLLRNIIGQLEGIDRMIDKKDDCFRVLVQMKAVKAAFENLMVSFSEENLIDCVSGIKKRDKEKMHKLIKELTKK